MSFTENAIPQLIIQEIYIPEGNDNKIKQVIKQDIIIYVLAIADLDNTESVSKFIQTNNDSGINNQVSQNTLQTIADFPLFSHDDSTSNAEDIDDSINLDFNEFINNDDILDTVQFNGQQLYVEGNNNNVNLSAEQIIYDLSWYDNYGLNSDFVFDESITFNDFLEDFVGGSLLDSVQVGFQDAILFGGGNNVVHELDQTLATFIFLNEDFAVELQENSSNLPLAQIAFQESFLDTDNNTIEQIIYQNIKLDFSFSNQGSTVGELTGEQLNDPNFNIDDFIVPILDNTVEGSPLFQNHTVSASQKNVQLVNTFGNNNTDSQDSSQILVLTDSENREVVFGTPNNDSFVVGLTENFDGLEDLVITGKGDDLVDLRNAFVDLNIPRFLIPTNTVVRAGKGDDEVIAYRGDEIFGNGGSDFLQTYEGGGENIFYGGLGDDTIIAGTDDIVFGNKGDDFLDGSEEEDIIRGGQDDDTLNGNSGNDQLWGNKGADSLNGGDDDDTLFGGADDDTLNGDSGNDLLWGNKGADSLNGGDDDDILYGGQDDDTLNGNSGNDLLWGNKGADSLNGGDNDDILYGGQDDDTLNGNSGNDLLWGNKGADSLNGGNDDDILYGGQNDDTLNGDSGNDELWGNKGNDFLRGGEGIDTFVLNKNQNNVGMDTIEDFQDGVDLIGLSGGLTFDDLSFSQSNILHQDQVLAILSGFDATSLTDADFKII